MDGGADCVQVREKELAGRRLCRRVEQVIEIARPRGVTVLVNDRTDVAFAAGADGVHLGQEDLSIAAARRLAGRTLMVGVSTHDLDQAEAAVAAGADYCGLGPVFATTTKAAGILAGPALVAAYAERFPQTPHLAIGGITPDNIDRLAEAGARGVAMSSAVCGAARPDEVVRAVRESVESAAASAV